MMRLPAGLLRRWLLQLLCAVGFFALVGAAFAATDTVSIASLPPEARTTLLLIKQGGPFPFSKDGAVFGNYEARLPKQKRGYYREYTVVTPRARNRGARRIIAAQPAGEYYYTDDHYDSFRRIQEP
ncbi:ribonuclease domain-containing protein [Undibacterium sp. CCC3.4]